MEGTLFVLRQAYNFPLPFGFSLGAMVVFLFSLPLLGSLIKKIF